MKNPRTTILGWLVLLTAVASAAVAVLDGNPATEPDLEAILAGLAGLGLITAKDGNR